jgi:hypothetical protein
MAEPLVPSDSSPARGTKLLTVSLGGAETRQQMVSAPTRYIVERPTPRDSCGT